MPDFVDQAIARLTEAGLVLPTGVLGCSEQEIAEITKEFSVTLPAAYRRFLATMGKSAGEFLDGTDFFYPEVLTLRGQAEYLLSKCKATISLATTDFVFASHQGYQFLFFGTEEGDDPRVRYYFEYREDFEIVASSFSEWLTGCVSDEIEATK